MRGSPLFRLAIVLGLFLLALVPLWRLTAAGEASPPANALPPPVEPASVSTQIEITCSRPATRLALEYLGKPVWSGSGRAAAATLTLPAAAFDLQVEAAWDSADPGENAVRIRVLRDDLPLADASFWGRDSVNDAFRVPAN